MKNLKFGIILLIVIVISCNKEELKYSCDPELDKYVTENQTDLKSAGVEELSTYDDELQRAVYRSLTPEEKYDLWNERLGLLAVDEQFSTEEQFHISGLQQQLSIDLFANENSEAFSTFLEFYSNWEQVAYTELNWDKSMVLFISTSLSMYYSDYTTCSTAMSSPVPMGGQECDCNRSRDGCPGGFYCKQVTCSNDTLTKGCGILMQEECNGACSPY